MDEFLKLLKAGWPYVVVAAPGLWAAWKAWSTSRRGDRKERVDLIRIAQEAAGEAIGHLRAEIADLRAEIAGLEAELRNVRKEHHEMMVAKDAKITLLEGEVRRWRALAESYERALAAAGVPHATPELTMWEAKDAGLFPTFDAPLEAQT